ncbi:MAG: endonuclease V [Chloroflexota bacterium]
MSQATQIFCMDVDYRVDHAAAAGILFDDWELDAVIQKVTVTIDQVAPYQSGEFYKRELPCLIKLIDQLATLPSVFIVDGFVYLDGQKKMGLGAYLWEHVGRKVPVIGVAKKRFKENTAAVEITRGKSQTPLFVTAAGIDLQIASSQIMKMHGKFRISTLLKQVDQLCRDVPSARLL